MDLQILWFILIGVLLTGFFFLEGFDYGVGMLLPFLGKNDTERRMILNSIGPFWDANEVWLIAAGGSLFAAFPTWYATMLSGFYPEMFLILFALILRGAAFEFRSQHESSGWRNFWDWMIFLGSLLPGFFWGVVIGNLMHGVPINAQGDYIGTFLTPFNPFAVLIGLAFDIFFVLHGAVFLSLRETGVLVKRAQRVVPFIWGVNLLFIALVVVTGFTATNVFREALLNPRVVPLDYVILASLVALLWLNARGRSGGAFAMSFVVILCSATLVVLCLFPNVMISSLNPAWSLTIRNASTNPYSLTVISWIGLTIIPFVMLYQAWNYWVFRKRIEPHAIGHY
ncbi:MAG: cytochrome d ubiquinol oxidase subunit II [Ktedonobacteraceae bacterium]